MADAATVREFESMHPEDVPEPIREEAMRLLSLTIPAEGGRQFPYRHQFVQCLYFLAVLTDDPRWDFLRGG